MRRAIIELGSRRNHGQHAGLLLQRYLAEPATGAQGNPGEKCRLLDDAISAAAAPEARSLYNAAFRRWERAFTELTAANDFRTESRLIVGLGSENVLETGIRLHQTYGLPVIPGSALKGLAAHYCHEIWGQLSGGDIAPTAGKRFRRGWIEESGEHHRLLFGNTEDSGCLIFHDAWLTPDSRNPLVRDVMTPHHPHWLNGAKPPTDFDSPVPVPFVSVVGTFRLAVSWHGPLSDKAAAWTNLGFALLAEALREWGVGGKTSSGYGMLLEVQASQRRSAFSAEALGLPAIGTVVSGTLFDPPKRNKPWRAKVTLGNGKELSGPIDLADSVPAGAGAGVSARLIVVYVDEKSIRFRWAT